jgi:DNA-directed RNA polymerase specialized sigma24 family protein
LKDENTNYVNYLIQLAQQGRKGAYIDLWEIFINSIYTTVKRLMGDEELIKEVLLRAFLEGWNRIRDYDVRVSFGTWLKNISIYMAIFELKTRYTLEEIKKPSIIVAIEDIQQLEAFIQTLQPSERIAFVLHDIEGYSYDNMKKYFSDLIIDEIKTIVVSTRLQIMSKIGI